MFNKERMPKIYTRNENAPEETTNQDGNTLRSCHQEEHGEKKMGRKEVWDGKPEINGWSWLLR
jgi:hypothetical protein